MTYCDYIIMQWYIRTCTCIIEQKFSLQKAIIITLWDIYIYIYIYTRQMMITIPADIDECMEYSPCDVNANCTNTKGSFNCACDTGFIGHGINCLSMSLAYVSPICII